MKTRHPQLIKLMVAVALVAALAPVMAAPVLACSEPIIEFYPQSGPVGTEVSVYYWSGQGHVAEYGIPGIWENSTIFGGIRVSHIRGEMPDGEFSFTVPDVPPGDYAFQVHDPYGHIALVIEGDGVSRFTVTEGPVIHNPSTIVGHTLERLNGKYSRVWGYDTADQTWKVYDSSKPAQRTNDLRVLERWQTIWIETTEDDVVLNWRGTLYFLGKGWNLITALGDTYGIGDVMTVSPGNEDNR
ncbi:MAG: hypothetical protein KJ624_00325 [Chloroflexi bacterium]|nr:hypothetical protein [Chloroflexota bacterium]